MKIINKDIEELCNFLLSLKLKGVENRMRNKFAKKLQNHLLEVQESHKDLLKEYCKQDENGDFVTYEQNGKSFYDVEDIKGFQMEFEQLMNEHFYIPFDEGTKDMLETVKNVVVNCEQEFSGQEALKFEGFCELFENELSATV